MPLKLRAVAARQAGLFTCKQAMEAGLRWPAIRGNLSPGGPWVTVRRGVYVERAQWERVEGARDEWRYRDRAARLCLNVRHVMSHDSAARCLGLSMLDPKLPLVHITRDAVGGSRTEAGVRHHLDRRRPTQLLETDGITHTGLARTCVDLAREHGMLHGLVVMDQAARRGTTNDELVAEIERMRSWPGITRAKEAVTLIDPGAENLGESIARSVVAEALPAVALRTQFPVGTPRGTFWVDILAGRLVVEFDGRIKYLSVADGGVATRSAADVVMDEKNRERLIAAAGFVVARLTFADGFGSARAAAVSWIRERYAEALHVHGDSPSPAHLEFAERMRDAREQRLCAV